ncbi:vegetative cell wall protein gp1-like [Pocillopora damicornis]|uniref:vegetative cell wall protein gp1-like n=1 Tax=Pocillopora damicornis TaxID=46731 RepID=UPI000F557412|nr:vegetative cell wall protein gp1-like [Pocillopora damicornis]
MRSCGPPQMLGVEAPPWSHPKPSYLLPRIRPSPPGRHCRMETPRVRFPASHSRPIHPPINIVPNAWQNTNMAYTDQGNNVVTRQNRHPSNPVGPFPGVAPWPRPFLPNNWPTPPPMGISAVQNPSAVNPMGPMPGVAPFPLPSSSNTWQTPLTMNVGPNTWEKNNVPDMEHGFWIPAEQNPFPHNYIGSGPMQVQQLSPYPTVPYVAEQSHAYGTSPSETVNP